MKKTLSFTYKAITLSDQFSAFTAEEYNRSGRPDVRCTRLKDALVVSMEEKNWTKAIEDVGSSGTVIHSYWTPTDERLYISRIAVTYDHAVLPSNMRVGYHCYDWANRQILISGDEIPRENSDIEVGSADYFKTMNFFSAKLTCLPIDETVSLNAEMPCGLSRFMSLAWCRFFMGEMHKLEHNLKVTRAARRLEKAIKAKTFNYGRAQRFIIELMLSIARS